MQYEVKNEFGQLSYGSLAEVRSLYQQGFITPDDLIKPRSSERWVAAGDMPALRASEARSRSETRMGVRVAFALLLSALLAALVAHQRLAALGALVAMGLLTPFVVYRKRRG